MLFLLILGNFWCSVVPTVTFSSKLGNFETKYKKKIQNINNKNLKKNFKQKS